MTPPARWPTLTSLASSSEPLRRPSKVSDYLKLLNLLLAPAMSTLALPALSSFTLLLTSPTASLPPYLDLLPSLFRALAFIVILPVLLLAAVDVVGWAVFKLVLRPLGYASTSVPTRRSELADPAQDPLQGPRTIDAHRCGQRRAGRRG